ncbi:MAG TPA: ATP-binding protein, partial [Bacillaceae bacterium]
KNTARTMKASKESDWTEADWLKVHKSIEGKIEEAVKFKQVVHIPAGSSNGRSASHTEGMDHLLIPFVSMGEVLGVIAVSKAGSFSKSHIQVARSIVDATAPTFSNLQYMDQLENMVEERTRELEIANEKVTSVIESITDGFFALDKEWNFTYINQHQVLPQGKTADEVLGKNIWDIFPEMVDTIMYTEFQRAMTERIPVQFEIPSSEDEDGHWHEAVAYPYDDGICCLFKNITEKKKYEKELRRLSSLDLIGQMAAGISHEIRNPMTTVRGFLQLLLQEDKFESYHGYFKLMIEEIDRANSIITEFLSMGNTRTSNLQVLNLNSIIHDITPLIKVDALSQDKLVKVVTEDIPDLLLNRNEIRQLLINLYRNGLEAMSIGQVLTIRTYKDEDHVVLAVQDEGKGISPDILEKLGTPFFTTKDEGTGLGLGVCYGIAARHNAKIEIETGADGTVFFIKFKIDP